MSSSIYNENSPFKPRLFAKYLNTSSGGAFDLIPLDLEILKKTYVWDGASNRKVDYDPLIHNPKDKRTKYIYPFIDLAGIPKLISGPFSLGVLLQKAILKRKERGQGKYKFFLVLEYDQLTSKWSVEYGGKVDADLMEVAKEIEFSVKEGTGYSADEERGGEDAPKKKKKKKKKLSP